MNKRMKIAHLSDFLSRVLPERGFLFWSTVLSLRRESFPCVVPGAGPLRITNLDRPFKISWILLFRAAFLSRGGCLCSATTVVIFPRLWELNAIFFFIFFLFTKTFFFFVILHLQTKSSQLTGTFFFRLALECLLGNCKVHLRLDRSFSGHLLQLPHWELVDELKNCFNANWIRKVLAGV